MSRRTSGPLFAALLFLCLAAGAAAQETSFFVDRVDVNIVNVEVFVTDRDGRHVEGLGPEDFEVFEDGKPVEVTNFYTVSRPPPGGPPAAEASAATEASPSAAGEGATADAEVPPEQRLHLLVYVDNFNIRPGNRKRVLASMEGFLAERTAAGDRVMVVTYDRGIETVQPFTDDPALIARALATVRETRAGGQTEDFRRRTAARNIAVALRDPQTAASARSYYERYVDETRANLLHSTRALAAVVRSLAGLPGRRALLYVSDGLPQRPGEQLAEQFFGGQSLTSDESTLFKDVLREANAQQVTLYTLDARGSLGATSTAETSDDVGGGVNRVALDAARTMNYQEPLIGMSDPTGGASLLNTDNFDLALATMAKDFDQFYSLGYPSRFSGDGAYHTIEVKVKRPGVAVRHRSGFIDKPAIEQVADRTLASLIAGTEKNPLGVRLEFEEPKKKGRKYLLPTLIRIPLRDLTLLPKGKVEEGRLRIFLVVQDADGGVSPLQDFPYPLSIPSDKIAAARKGAIGHLTRLEIGPGEQKIAVGVFDEVSGTESFTHQVLVIGEKK